MSVDLDILQERVALLEQGQIYMEKTIIAHMKAEEINTKDIKEAQSKIFEKIDDLREDVNKNTVESQVGIRSIKSTVVIVGGILGAFSVIISIILAVNKIF